MSDSPTTPSLQLQRAVFLRGVSDPSDQTRITTVFYKPKHMDLRYEGGFIRSGTVSVPVSNVVEMMSAVEETAEEPAVLDAPTESPNGESVHEEADKPVRRRGRPRKNPV